MTCQTHSIFCYNMSYCSFHVMWQVLSAAYVPRGIKGKLEEDENCSLFLDVVLIKKRHVMENSQYFDSTSSFDRHL